MMMMMMMMIMAVFMIPAQRDAFFSSLSGHVFILKRNSNSGYDHDRAIQAHSLWIESVALNSYSSILATVCWNESEVKLWNVKDSMCTFD
jgi:hypothetical protein